MSDRPPKLPYCASRVVKALRALTFAQKLVWLELQWMDNGGQRGAFLGAGALADRLGTSPETVERSRRELTAMGFLRTGRRVAGQALSYYPTLPPDCIPASQKPSASDVLECARRLDTRLIGTTGVTGDAISSGTGNTRDAIPASPVRPSGVTRVGRRRTGDATHPEKLAALVTPVLAQLGGNDGGTGDALLHHKQLIDDAKDAVAAAAGTAPVANATGEDAGQQDAERQATPEGTHSPQLPFRELLAAAGVVPPGQDRT